MSTMTPYERAVAGSLLGGYGLTPEQAQEHITRVAGMIVQMKLLAIPQIGIAERYYAGWATTVHPGYAEPDLVEAAILEWIAHARSREHAR